MKTCIHYEISKDDTDFPYLTKGKQQPNAPRQDVCKRCRSVLHERKYGRRKLGWVERFDAGIVGRQMKDQSASHWKMTARQEQEIALMHELWDARDMTDSVWLNLCAGVAV